MHGILYANHTMRDGTVRGDAHKKNGNEEIKENGRRSAHAVPWRRQILEHGR